MVEDSHGDYNAPIINAKTPETQEDYLQLVAFVNPDGDLFESGTEQDISFVEVMSTSSDSRGGCCSLIESVCVMYARITCKLRNAGVEIVNHSSEMF